LSPYALPHGAIVRRKINRFGVIACFVTLLTYANYVEGEIARARNNAGEREKTDKNRKQFFSRTQAWEYPRARRYDRAVYVGAAYFIYARCVTYDKNRPALIKIARQIPLASARTSRTTPTTDYDACDRLEAELGVIRRKKRKRISSGKFNASAARARSHTRVQFTLSRAIDIQRRSMHKFTDNRAMAMTPRRDDDSADDSTGREIR